VKNNPGNLPSAPSLSDARIRKAKRAYLEARMQPNAHESDALIASGITLSQLQRWRETDPEFAMLEKQCELFKDDELRKRIDALIESGNASIIALAMRRLPEYNPAKKTEVSVSGQVNHKVLAGQPESELDKIIMAGAQLIEDVEYEEVKTGDLRLPPPEANDQATD